LPSAVGESYEGSNHVAEGEDPAGKGAAAAKGGAVAAGRREGAG